MLQNYLNTNKLAGQLNCLIWNLDSSFFFQIESRQSTTKIWNRQSGLATIYILWLCLSYFNPLAAEIIYLATSDECAGLINWPSIVLGLDFMKKFNDEFLIFLHFYVYVVVSYTFGGFLEKLTKQCCHAKTVQLVSQQSLSIIINKIQTFKQNVHL